MTPIDDLKVGMFVAVVDRDEPDDCDMPSLWMSVPLFNEPKKIRRQRFTGQPLEVLAISLPFLCVTDGRQRFAIDVRETRVRKLSRQFVEAMTAEVAKADFTKSRRRKRKEKPDPKRCPRCGCRRVERLIQPGTGNWGLHCPQCGMNDLAEAKQ